VGNAAVHENVGTTADALSALKIARGAAVWFHQSYGGKPTYKPGPLVPPTPPLMRQALSRPNWKNCGNKSAPAPTKQRKRCSPSATLNRAHRANTLVEQRFGTTDSDTL
jgi:hypothetical protein